MVELVVSSGIQLSDSLNLPEIMVPALVDTGAQIEVLAGEERFPSAALIDAFSLVIPSTCQKSWFPLWLTLGHKLRF